MKFSAGHRISHALYLSPATEEPLAERISYAIYNRVQEPPRMLAIVLMPWLRKLAWARTEEHFTADDPWNDNRRTDFTIESYVYTFTGKPVGPWPKDVRDITKGFTRALRSGTDGILHLMPESLSDLWIRGQVPAQALPWLLKEIEPTLKNLDYRGSAPDSPPELISIIECVVCFFGLVITVLMAYTVNGSLIFRLQCALWFALVVVLLGYPSTTIRRHRRRRQIKWFLKQMRTYPGPTEPSIREVPAVSGQSIKPDAVVPVPAVEAVEAQNASRLRTLEEIKVEFARINSLIGNVIHWHAVPTVDTASNQRYNSAAIEVDAAGYQFFCNDRGREYKFFTTTDFEKIFYWSFKEAISLLAVDFARENKTPGQDQRRVSHARGIELFTRFCPTCAERWKAEIAESLAQYPYDDSYEVRVALHQQLIGEGTGGADSWRMALERYPTHTPKQSLRPF